MTALTKQRLRDLSAPDVFLDVFREHVEWYVSAEHHGVIEGFRVKLRSQCLLRNLALPVDLAVSHLVAARLAGPGAIAIDFAGDFQRIRPVHFDEELHSLFTCPSFGVNAGVDHQPARTEGDRLKIRLPLYILRR